MISRTFAGISAILSLSATAGAQKSVEYEISFPNAAQHEVLVTAVFRGVPAGSPLEARMSRSSPGRYAISTFAKNVFDLSAVDGRNRKVDLVRVGPYGWEVRGHDGTVRLSYKVWGDRIDGTYLSVDHAHAHINMPSTFMFAHGMEKAPIRLTIHPLPGWSVATQLAPTRTENVFSAPDMQWFMDSPTEVGPVTFRTWTETHGGKRSTFRIAMHHLGTEAQVDSFAAMVRQVVDEEIAMWGEPAGYDLGTYTFIHDFLPWSSGDGMEHRNSTIITSRNPITDRTRQLRNLGTVSHEFFHSWNMERLRSKAIEPFDFEREDMSGDLWFGEGFTNYYGPLFIRRAGFYSDEDYARIIGEAVIGTINAPARQHGSPVAMSELATFYDGGSFADAVNTPNLFLSYYSSGSVVALGLDLILREKYGSSLDDYMRALWRDFGRKQSSSFAPERPYVRADLERELAVLTKDSAFARNFFARYIEGTEVPDFAPLLAPAGFLFATDSVERPYLGASLDDDTSRVFVNWSAEGGSAFAAGLASGDMVYAIDGIPAVSIDSLNAIIGRHKPGDVVQADVLQREVRRTVSMKIVGRRGLKLSTFENAGLPVTSAIREFRESWLGARRH